MDTSPDTGIGIVPSPFQSAQDALTAATDLDEAARNLATFWIHAGVPFTSGHLTSAIREARSDLRFRHATMGQINRTLFENGELPSYDDGIHGEIRPVRVMRQTTRTDTRTPVGTEVYVIGPDEFEIDAFEFEINIAEAPSVSDGQGGQTSAANAVLNATPTVVKDSTGTAATTIPPVTPSGKVAVANGKMVPGNPLATVHADGRLCIPRIAFEALAFETGNPVTGGEPLYVIDNSDTSGQVRILLSNSTGGDPIPPTTDRLRMHLRLASKPTVGDSFEIVVGSTGLTINL